MKQTIDPNREYRISEIARASKQNPKGLGLMPLNYLAVRRRVLSGALPSRQETIVERILYYVKGEDLIKYLKADKVTVG